MATLALLLKYHLHKPSYTLLKSTIFSHYFSSSSNNNSKTDNLSSYLTDIKSKLKQQQQSPIQSSPQSSPSSDFDADADAPVKPYSFSTSFTDIKSRLKQHVQHQQQQQQQQQRSSGLDSLGLSTTPSQSKSTDEIRRDLSEFRRRSSVEGENKIKGVELLSIRDSLRELRNASSDKDTNTMSFNDNTTSFRARLQVPVRDRGGVVGGSALPLEVFGKELKEEEAKKAGGVEEEEEEVWMESYTMDELGKRLRNLRPVVEGKEGGEGFSISELNERLKKLKEIDEKGVATKNGSVLVSSRKIPQMVKNVESQKQSPYLTPIHGFDIMGLGQLSYTRSSPKEHLVEKYFHPDNMSAEEKLKLELKKVREEFKMHESDCGSTRVQVAQLTVEILHLSSVLHKKDKHSRRGLQAKVQQRKKLLKYLRRTDWESYCFAISKLGLRDTPDYKN